jgi:hypothetical protein
LRNAEGKSRTGAFAQAVARGVWAELLGFFRELSGEVPYRRYVEGRRGRRFPEGSIMTRGEYERWHAELQEKRVLPSHDVDEQGPGVERRAAVRGKG